MERGSSLETARTMAVSAVVAAEMFYLLNSRYIFKTVLSLDGLFGNRYVLIAIVACALLQLMYTHAGPLQDLFGSTDLSPDEWFKVVLAGALVFVVAEFEKTVLRAWKRWRQHAAKTAAQRESSHSAQPQAPRSILAAVDFSDDAGNAALQAALLAVEQRGTLKLLHVVDEASLKAVRELIRLHDAAEAKLIADAQHQLDALRAQLAEQTQVVAVSRVVIGQVLDEILAAAAHADLLVLGARGANPLRDLLLGTTADSLLRAYTGAVLLVKRPPQQKYRRVLVPIDFSPHAIGALKTALLIAPEAEIFVLHAFKPPLAGHHFIANELDDEVEQYCDEARRHALSMLGNLTLETADHQHRFVRIVEAGDAVSLILAKEVEHNADLIVMGKHGESIVEEMLLGSVTRHVLADSKCDVMIVR